MRKLSVQIITIVLLCNCIVLSRAADLLPIPDKLVAITFDDGSKTDLTYAAPLLKKYGFGATIFITEGLNTKVDKKHYLTWEECKMLNDDGFEIGNHTATHPAVSQLSRAQFITELEVIENRCKEHGIPLPKTFCYPGYASSPMNVKVLESKGYLFARRGVAPEGKFTDEGDSGPAYDSESHDPLLVPTTAAFGPNFTFDMFVEAVAKARDGKICVLTYHGVPSVYPWNNCTPKLFAQCMKYLYEHNYKVIALRDLARYVAPLKFRENRKIVLLQRRNNILNAVRTITGDKDLSQIQVKACSADSTFSKQYSVENTLKVGGEYNWLAEDGVVLPTSIIYDLGKEENIRAIDVAQSNYITTDYYFTENYSIENSLDGRNWKTITSNNLPEKRCFLQTNVFEPIKARYIKIVIKSNFNRESVGLSEVCIYGISESPNKSVGGD